MKKIIILLTTLQLVACGGGSSGSDEPSKDLGTPDITEPDTTEPDTTEPDTQPANVISGVMLDPYITQAKVCLDANSNAQCDEGEQVVETNEEGYFEFTLETALETQAQILVLNRGSFQEPDYGYHAGIPYQLPLSAVVPVGENQLLVTPASTAMNTMNIDSATLVSIINQFSDKIGKTLSAADLTTDPFANLVAHQIDADALAVLRTNLVLYAVLRTLDAMQSIDTTEAISANFATEALIDTSVTYEVIESIVNHIAGGINQPLIDNIQQVIDQGNQSLIAASQVGMPNISTEVVMSTAAAIADLYIDQAITAVVVGLDTHITGTFDERFDAIAADVIANMNVLSAQENLASLMTTLGTKTYATVNKSHFSEYSSFVRNSIFNAEPLLKEGYECETGHIAVGNRFNEDYSAIQQSTLCTNGIPKQVSAQVNAEKHDESVAVEEDMWANLPVGSLRVSDVALGCTFKGTVKDESGTAIQFIPMYMSFPAYQLEMHVQTDAQGEFSFTHIPVEGHFGFRENENHADPQYFFGTNAGVHGAHPAFKTKESVSDFNVRCFNEGDVFTLNPTMKNIAADTVIKGTIDTALLGQGFKVEIHAEVPNNTLQLNDIDQPRRAWIMDTIGVEEFFDHPHMDFDENTGVYEKRALAGGRYFFRVSVGKTEQRDSFEFEIQTEHVINVAAGEEVTVNLEIDESSKQYTLTIDGDILTGNYTPN